MAFIIVLVPVQYFIITIKLILHHPSFLLSPHTHSLEQLKGFVKCGSIF